MLTSASHLLQTLSPEELWDWRGPPAGEQGGQLGTRSVPGGMEIQVKIDPENYSSELTGY